MGMLGMNDTNRAGQLRRYSVPAQRIGVPVEEYQRRIEGGEKWCSYTKHWGQLDEFALIGTGRRDNYCLSCRQLVNAVRRQHHATHGQQ